MQTNRFLASLFSFLRFFSVSERGDERAPQRSCTPRELTWQVDFNDRPGNNNSRCQGDERWHSRSMLGCWRGFRCFGCAPSKPSGSVDGVGTELHRAARRGRRGRRGGRRACRRRSGGRRRRRAHRKRLSSGRSQRRAAVVLQVLVVMVVGQVAVELVRVRECKEAVRMVEVMMAVVVLVVPVVEVRRHVPVVVVVTSRGCVATATARSGRSSHDVVRRVDPAARHRRRQRRRRRRRSCGTFRLRRVVRRRLRLVRGRRRVQVLHALRNVGEPGACPTSLLDALARGEVHGRLHVVAGLLVSAAEPVQHRHVIVVQALRRLRCCEGTVPRCRRDRRHGAQERLHLAAQQLDQHFLALGGDRSRVVE
mmetsp:Transcript_17934/g.55699  ORF Transcript_17934/g.55699 Transcript_17934/m.55699 type:complete len:366 (-) Transcript_17934:358-1455(-)